MENCLAKIDIDKRKRFIENHKKHHLYVYQFEIVTKKERFIFIGNARDTKSCFGHHKRLLLKEKHLNNELLKVYLTNKDSFYDFKFYLIGRIKSDETKARKIGCKIYNNYKNMYHGKLDSYGRKINIISRRW